MFDYMYVCKFVKIKRLLILVFVLNVRLVCFVFLISRIEDFYVLGCFYIFLGYS